VSVERHIDGVHVRIDGREGAPWVTFLNSIATDLGIWDAQVAAFGSRFQLLRMDAPGH